MSNNRLIKLIDGGSIGADKFDQIQEIIEENERLRIENKKMEGQFAKRVKTERSLIGYYNEGISWYTKEEFKADLEIQTLAEIETLNRRHDQIKIDLSGVLKGSIFGIKKRIQRLLDKYKFEKSTEDDLLF